MIKEDYLEKYLGTYKEIAEDEKGMELISRIAETCTILDECAEHLKDEGSVISMSQGKYDINVENPYSKIRAREMKNFLKLRSQLETMLNEKRIKRTAFKYSKGEKDSVEFR